MNILLISTYELGRQPFGLASPAAWLRNAGFSVDCLDLSREPLSGEAVSRAGFIAFYVPMHTATRLAAQALPGIRQINPKAHFCFYGLYAPVNEAYLRKLGAQTILGGEFEEAMVQAARRVKENLETAGARGGVPSQSDYSDAPWLWDGFAAHGPNSRAGRLCEGLTEEQSAVLEGQREPVVSLSRLRFVTPDRSGLPELSRYARLLRPEGEPKTAGYTEASRGCKHVCRHCPIVPVYQGRFRIVPQDVVLEDIHQQVAAGARHITFGDPDFFNGIRHAVELVTALHHEHPGLTYDVTIKVEHLLRYAEHMRTLRDTGCLFVTTAVESFRDQILARLEKNHTYSDFRRVLELSRRRRLGLAPTFVAFNPWTTLESYCDFLDTIAKLDLVQDVAPVQLSIRLLIPAGSRLLELDDIRNVVDAFDEAQLMYPWRHSDPSVDRLYHSVQAIVREGLRANESRIGIFERVRGAAQTAAGKHESTPWPELPPLIARAAIPYLTEPWYC